MGIKQRDLVDEFEELERKWYRIPADPIETSHRAKALEEIDRISKEMVERGSKEQRRVCEMAC